MKRQLWILYGAAQPRRVVDVLEYAEAGSTPAGLIPGWTGAPGPYRCTAVTVRLAGGKQTSAPLAHLVHATRAEVDQWLAHPYGWRP